MNFEINEMKTLKEEIHKFEMDLPPYSLDFCVHLTPEQLEDYTQKCILLRTKKQELVKMQNKRKVSNQEIVN